MSMRGKKILTRVLLVGALLAPIAGCVAAGNQMGMVTDRRTGLKYGSVIQKSIFIDAEQFEDSSIKVTTRNTSGDVAFDLHQFTDQLRNAYEAKGFDPVRKNYGLKLDVNVVYSGHIQSNMARQYAFLGAAAGGIAGHRSNVRAGTAIGVLAGATLGAVLGGARTIDTYIVVADVAIGVAEVGSKKKRTGKTVTFGASQQKQETRRRALKPFRSVLRTKVAVYGGGANVSQHQVAAEVKRRLIRIVSDVI